MEILNNGIFTGERALYAKKGIRVCNSVFEDGESPLKECEDIEVFSSTFRWKYPMWYSSAVFVENSTLEETARSGIWYTRDITMKDCKIDAPKTFRKSEGIVLHDCKLENALETLWSCKNVQIKNCRVIGDYCAMNCEDFYGENIILDGNYFLDGAKNVVIKNSVLNSKDSFWNCENVTVYDSVIVGEYIGWNSKNVTFVNCKIESNQGFCYMENLRLENCVLENTDLAFEFSTVDATVNSKIDSVKNVISGKIVAQQIGEIIMQEEFVVPSKTEIIIKK